MSIVFRGHVSRYKRIFYRVNLLTGQERGGKKSCIFFIGMNKGSPESHVANTFDSNAVFSIVV